MAVSEVIKDRELDELIAMCGAVSSDDRRGVEEKLRSIRGSVVKKVIASMVWRLYGNNNANLPQDAARVALAAEEAHPVITPGERRKVLEVLWWLYRVYFDNNIEGLLLICGAAQEHRSVERGGEWSGDR
ncbi:MAG: hypothetical protein NC123_15380 [Butyrivibrio sp.]|nr:hypothetical protein [Butyrivibrio sp.]